MYTLLLLLVLWLAASAQALHCAEHLWQSLNFVFLSFLIHRLQPSCIKEGRISFLWSTKGTKGSFPFILSCYRDLQVQPLQVLPDSSFERGPDPGVTGLSSPAVYIALYNSMGASCGSVRAQLHYAMASLNVDISVPPDSVAPPFTVSYWNRGPKPLNTCMDIVSVIPQQPFRWVKLASASLSPSALWGPMGRVGRAFITRKGLWAVP